MIKCFTAMAVVCLLLYSAVIVKGSYPLYSKAASMVAVDKTLTNVYLEDNEALQSAVQVTPGDVTVHTAAFRKLLQNNDFAVTEDTVWLYFGSYYKIPGIGLGGNIIEVNLADDKPVQTIPYETEEDFQTLLLKYMF